MSPPRIGSRVAPQPRPISETPPPRPDVKARATPLRDERGVSGFDAKPRSAGPVALAASAPTSRGTGVTPGTYPNSRDVEAISAMKDPVARNVAITQGYSDLSSAVGQMLGTENASWATFGTWASKQAGVSIRQEDMPKLLVDALHGAGDVTGPLAKVDDILRKVGLPALPGLSDIAQAGAKALDSVSQAIADGNQLVFHEVGTEFARFIETFQGDTAFDAAKTQKYLESFPADKPLLKQAFGHYAEAMFEKDPNKKAELMLLANDQIGLHEQTRLQPYVEKALNTPVKETFRDLLKQSIQGAANALPFPANLAAKAAIKSGVVDAALSPVVDGLASTFRRFATDHMMKLAVPGGALKLGNDLPPPAGMEKDLFPANLRTLENPELRELMGKLDRTPDSLHGTAAKDWSRLDQRMNYIIDLFRSRQSDPHLFDPPFGKRGQYPVRAEAPRVA
ncbi:hypothetical protein DRW03_12230 [Corallococcus sp. H22C18031201]|nr:hypothetical protein [Citreicoccus inhibens]MBU8894212.1 hypothetical protein [Citreicoccus inhibens]RJS23091.1 hypothetical protein DRW03_12230 [Corallococcus sp. H22C18031201]